MEILGLISVPNWLLYLVALLVVAYYYYTWNYGVWKKLGIPGPKPYPAIGLFHIFAKHGFFDTDRVLMKEYGKIVGIVNGRDPAMIVGDADVLRRILVKDFSNFQDRMILPLRGIFKKSLLDARGDHWHHLRRLMTPAFSTGKLKQMVPLFRVCADRLAGRVVEKVQAQEDIDINEYCGAFTMDAIASVAFGMEIDSQKDKNNPFVVNMRKLLDFSIFHPIIFVMVFLPFVIPILEYFNYGERLMKPAQFFCQVIKETLKQRRQGIGVRVDILQLLLDAEHHLDEVEDEPSEDGVEISKVTSRKKKKVPTATLR